MKHLLLLALIVFVFTGCEKPDFLKSEAEKATPVPRATPLPTPATPKPGSWMLKDYKNPLDQKKK